MRLTKEFSIAHPGNLVKYLLIDSIKLTPEDVAKLIGISVEDFLKLISNEISINEDIAYKLSQFFTDTQPQDWIKMQQDYDAWHNLDDNKTKENN